MTNLRPEKQQPGRQMPARFPYAVMGLSIATALAFLWLGTRLVPGSNLPENELRILSRAFAAIDEDYIFELDDQGRRDLLHAAISGMVEDLDRYSHYYRPEDEEAYKRETHGVLTGIGIVVQTVEDKVLLLYPIPGGPAEAADMMVGDILTAIDGKPVTATGDAVELIKGPRGTHVRLTIRRGDAEQRVIAVQRKEVRIASVKWARVLDAQAGVGYIFLQKFTRSSVEELDAAITQLRSSLGKVELRGLVLDIRRNPGGLLSTCLKLTNRFVKQGKLLTIQPRNKPEEVHVADPAVCLYPDMKLVLLIDHESASASEVMAGALQDHARARLVGTRSWGKGVVNEVYRWSDQKVRLKLTTSYYVTPKGRKIERHLRKSSDDEGGGILPDKIVECADKKQRTAILQQLYRREVPPIYRTQVAKLQDKFPGIQVLQPLPTKKDPQLDSALAELRLALQQVEKKK
ncbi:MAG: S41 family peptidase [Planctomycetota bacterium]|nr:S41 family peptidase [Planctomycetota bacterium]